MSNTQRFERAFAEMPLIAILRGLQPDRAEAVGAVLVDAGFTLLEVPLNSPDPLNSIARLARTFGDRVLVGAGTVLKAVDVDKIKNVGGSLVISPNCDTGVISATVRSGLVSLPGIFTPTEAVAALEAGATALKFFPAEAASPATIRALKSVLPSTARILPVGGITPDALPIWHAANAAGFGLGSALFQPTFEADQVHARAKEFVLRWRSLTGD